MKKQLLCLWLFLFTLPLLYAEKSDSLLKVLTTAVDTHRVWVLNDLCMEFAYSDPAKGKQFATEALELSGKMDYTLGKAKALNRLGIIDDVTGKYDSSIYYYLQAAVYFVKANNIRGKASSLNNIGKVYSTLGNYNRAIANHFEALKIFESINDELSVASALNNIGNVYADLGKYTLAFRYYFRASEINKRLNDSDALASNYTNIASSLRESNKLDSSIIYMNKSIAIQTVTNNQYGLGILYSLLGNTYMDKKDYRQALYFSLKSLQMRNALNDEAGKASVLVNIADEYSGLKNPAMAEKYAMEAHLLALRLNSYRMLRKTSMLLFYLYNRAGKYNKAVQYVDMAMLARDSALNEESSKHVAELETKYETAKQAFELEKTSLALDNATLEIGQKRSTIIALIVAFLFIVMLGMWLYNRNRHKQQRAMDAQLLSQQELRNKAIIEAEEKERVRIARELHDGIGQQLSAAKMNLSAFESRMPAEERDGFHYLIQLVDDAVKEVRTISHNMIPNALLRSGLASAVRDFVTKLSLTGSLKIDLEILGINGRLDTSTETVLYRVIQECMSNIVKHAEASHVNIQLIKHPDHLNLLIQDNGKGFDTSNIDGYEGIGLKNIVSRVKYLDGNVDFDSMPGGGTTMSVDVPTGD
jgi:two-component system NarL family sensor kinase